MAVVGTYFKVFLFLTSLVLLWEGYSANLTQYNVELVQVLFRHGDRTPRKEELYPKWPYNPSIFKNVGLGQLTSKGLEREYRLGMLLRSLYNDFMGTSYSIGDLAAVSTDFDRTKVSLQLVLAGLYPVETSLPLSLVERSTSLIIPTSYTPQIVDSLLMAQYCPLYMQELQKVKNLPDVIKKLDKFRSLFEDLQEKTGMNVTAHPITEVGNFYQLLTSQESLGIATPKWVTHQMRRDIEKVVKLGYDIFTYNKKMKRLTGGMVMEQFIKNMDLNETYADKTKMYLYSAHDLNVGFFARSNGFRLPVIPDYGSAIIVEKLRDCFKRVYIRMLLWTGVTEKLIPYVIPRCGKVCPVEKYLKIMHDIIPTDEESNCMWNAITKNQLRDYFEEQSK